MPIFNPPGSTVSTYPVVEDTAMYAYDQPMGVGAAVSGNTGNPTFGNTCIIVGSSAYGPGVYTVTMNAATTFDVTNPAGGAVGSGTLGTAFSANGISFLLTAGGTAAIAGDKFTITVKPPVVTQRYMPKLSRIIKSGEIWFAPTAISGTAVRTANLDTSASYLAQSNVAASTPLLINNLTNGFTSLSWGSLNLAMPSDGLLQGLVWVDDYENGAAAFNSLSVTITGASGAVTYGYAIGSGLFPGWNTIQLWNPATPANAVCANTGVTWITANTGYNFTDPITAINVTLNTPTAGAVTRFAGLFTQTKVQPMAIMTFDTSAQDIFANFVPLWKSYGWSAGLRAGGADSYRSPTWSTPLKTALGLGMDVYNGSWSRIGSTTSTAAAVLSGEAGRQQNWASRNGLGRGGTLFSTLANSSAKQSVMRTVFPALGIKTAKAGTAPYLATMIGPAGLDNRYNVKALGMQGITLMKAQVDGIIYTGGLLLWFGHECPIYGGTPPDSGSPGNGGGIYYEHAVLLAAYMAPSVAAGTLNVVGVTQMEMILDGLL